MPMHLFFSLWSAICEANKRRVEEIKRIRNGR